jgi:hypothetical protein
MTKRRKRFPKGVTPLARQIFAQLKRATPFSQQNGSPDLRLLGLGRAIPIQPHEARSAPTAWPARCTG